MVSTVDTTFDMVSNVLVRVLCYTIKNSKVSHSCLLHCMENPSHDIIIYSEVPDQPDVELRISGLDFLPSIMFQQHKIALASTSFFKI